MDPYLGAAVRSKIDCKIRPVAFESPELKYVLLITRRVHASPARITTYTNPKHYIPPCTLQSPFYHPLAAQKFTPRASPAHK